MVGTLWIFNGSGFHLYAHLSIDICKILSSVHLKIKPSCQIETCCLNFVVQIVILRAAGSHANKWRTFPWSEEQEQEHTCFFFDIKAFRWPMAPARPLTKKNEDNQKDKCDSPPVWGTRWMWNRASLLWCLWPGSSKLDSGLWIPPLVQYVWTSDKGFVHIKVKPPHCSFELEHHYCKTRKDTFSKPGKWFMSPTSQRWWWAWSKLCIFS